MYRRTVIENEEHRIRLMKAMEEEFGRGRPDYFLRVIEEEQSLVLRLHAVCILAQVGGQESVPTLAYVLPNDSDPLVRHEAPFSLGEIGYASAAPPLERAHQSDPDPIVRHEAAVALGSIRSQTSRTALQGALADGDEIVRNSARASLFNLDFLRKYDGGSTARDRAPRPLSPGTVSLSAVGEG